MQKINLFETIKINFYDSDEYKSDIIRFNYRLFLSYLKKFMLFKHHILYVFDDKIILSLNHNTTSKKIFNEISKKHNEKKKSLLINIILSISYLISFLNLKFNLNDKIASKTINLLTSFLKDKFVFLDYDTTPVEISICINSRSTVIQHGVFSDRQFEKDQHSKYSKNYIFLNNSIKENLIDKCFSNSLSPSYNPINLEYNLEVRRIYWIGQPQYLISKQIQEIYEHYFQLIFKLCNEKKIELIYLKHPAEDYRLKKLIQNITTFSEIKKNILRDDLFLSFDSTLLFELTQNNLPSIQVCPIEFSLERQKLFPSYTFENFQKLFKNNIIEFKFTFDSPISNSNDIQSILYNLK